MMISTAALKPGSIGIGVNKQQTYLNMMQEKGFINIRSLQDGVYGTRTEQAVRRWQRYINLPIDGEIDNDTQDSIVNKLRDLQIVTNTPVTSSFYYLSSGAQGISVFKIQEYLDKITAVNKCLRPISVDSMYDPRTTTMVQQFQYLYDLNIDGVIGRATWDVIVNEHNELWDEIHKTITGGLSFLPFSIQNMIIIHQYCDLLNQQEKYSRSYLCCTCVQEKRMRRSNSRASCSTYFSIAFNWFFRKISGILRFYSR